MPREQNLELKVGIFVVVALTCLVVFVFFISDFSLFQEGRTLQVRFGYANGLKKSSPVMFAGVEAGHVRSIKVSFDEKTQKTVVNVDAWIDQRMTIPADSRFVVNQLGLLGEKYLEIMPGSSKDLLAANSVVQGDDSVPIEAITRQISALGTKLEITVDSINNGILSKKNQESFTEALDNTAKLTANLNNAILTEANSRSVAVLLANLATLSEKINKGEGTIGKLMTNSSVYTNLDEMTADLKANPWKLFYRPKGK